MSYTLPLGALKKDTNEYIYPSIASKLDRYICPECKKDLILKQGNIRVHHFSHVKDDSPCNYYIKPSETQIHKDAKMLIKSLLEQKKQITITRKCFNNTCSDIEEYEIPLFSELSKSIIEYRFNFNGIKIADVAYIDNNELFCIFEIYNTHRTEEINRPEPWFEIDAKELINIANSNPDSINIKCIRRKRCDDCELLECHRCSYTSPKKIMLTNTNYKWCKQCDIEFYDKTFIDIPFRDKDEIKEYGARFDGLYKKWYIDNKSKNKEFILKKWKLWSFK
jgi:hypothetical protein